MSKRKMAGSYPAVKDEQTPGLESFKLAPLTPIGPSMSVLERAARTALLRQISELLDSEKKRIKKVQGVLGRDEYYAAQFAEVINIESIIKELK